MGWKKNQPTFVCEEVLILANKISGCWNNTRFFPLWLWNCSYSPCLLGFYPWAVRHESSSDIVCGNCQARRGSLVAGRFLLLLHSLLKKRPPAFFCNVTFSSWSYAVFSLWSDLILRVIKRPAVLENPVIPWLFYGFPFFLFSFLFFMKGMKTFADVSTSGLASS